MNRQHSRRERLSVPAVLLGGSCVLLILVLVALPTVGEARTPPSLPRSGWSDDIAISTSTGEQGEARYAPPGIALVPDGSGGLYIAWEDFWWINVNVQRIGADGTPRWGEGGLPVAPYFYQYTPRMISDGSGGIILAWMDGRMGWCSPTFAAECDIFAQRYGPNGAALLQSWHDRDGGDR